MRKNAARLGATALVDACDHELTSRGKLNLTTDQATIAHNQAERMRGKTLYDVIFSAFSEIPAKDYEIKLLNIMQKMPRSCFQDIQSRYGMNDLSLAAGHLVYNRIGFFSLYRFGFVGREIELDLQPVRID